MAKRIDRSTPLFQVTDLCQYFNVGRGKVLKAVEPCMDNDDIQNVCGELIRR